MTHLRELSRTAPSVRDVTFLERTAPRSRTAPLDDVAVRELNAVAGILESLAVFLAPPFDGRRRAGLRAANARLRAARDPVAAAIADRDVHRRLVEACSDESLLGTLEPIEAALRHLAATGGVRDPERHATEHDAVIDALAAGDNAGAAERLRKHVAARLPALLAAVATRTDHTPHAA
jgi:DNA-binding GntR family transcriptional regulator